MEWSDFMTKNDIVSALDELGYDPETAGEAIDDIFQVHSLTSFHFTFTIKNDIFVKIEQEGKHKPHSF